MFARPRTWLLALALLAGLALVVAMVVVTLGRPPAPTPMPSPNGYDDFLKAGAAVPANIGDYYTLSNDALRDLISTNAESLRLLRLGLTRQCSLPADAAMTNTAGMMNDLANMKRLVLLLIAEGRLRELDNQPVEAAHIYLDAIHFGNEISRGGFMITRLVGIACEAIGRSPLSRLAPKLTPAEARGVIAELEKMDNTRITWDEVSRNENRYFYHALRQYPNPILWAQSLWNVRAARQRGAEKNNRIIALERLVAGELALRCYYSDHACAPARLEDLVPGYLSKVPLDSYTGRPMIYRPQGTNWLLYSVGPDLVDNGGRPGRTADSRPGDVFYNAP
jgi:hypothetical protein